MAASDCGIGVSDRAVQHSIVCHSPADPKSARRSNDWGEQPCCRNRPCRRDHSQPACMPDDRKWQRSAPGGGVVPRQRRGDSAFAFALPGAFRCRLEAAARSSGMAEQEKRAGLVQFDRTTFASPAQILFGLLSGFAASLAVGCVYAYAVWSPPSNDWGNAKSLDTIFLTPVGLIVFIFAIVLRKRLVRLIRLLGKLGRRGLVARHRRRCSPAGGQPPDPHCRAAGGCPGGR